MKKYFILNTFLIFILLLCKSCIYAENYTSTRTDSVIRVGISSNDFRQLEHREITLSSDGKLEVSDKFFNTKITTASPGDCLTFTIEKTSFSVLKNKEKLSGKVFGLIMVKSLDENPIKVMGLKRKGKQAAYRGYFELIRVPGKKDKLSLVNVLPLEEYLKGVVPNELPPSFGKEALKAQSIAARNYAIRPRIKIHPQFDLCDSVRSQVYFGYNTEASESNEAVDCTKGLVALHDGEVILALYSSAAGGHTESYENAFSEPGGENFPAEPLPYLKGKPDILKFSPLDTEKKIRKFYTSKPDSFDVNSRYFRWTREWTGEDLRQVLNQSLSRYAGSKLISPQFKKGNDIGQIKEVKVISRGVSGKAIAIRVKTSKGEWIIKKELLIRRVFKNNGKALPSANLVFDNFTDNGYLEKLRAYGGGFGHGVGMSQYGASYMSGKGFSFDQILQHYYTDIAIGTWPVYLVSEYDSSPVKQEFISINGNADLLVENPELAENFSFVINKHKITLGKDQFKHEKIRVPLDNFVKKGINEIIYYPVDKTEEKSIKAWIEVFRKTGENK